MVGLNLLFHRLLLKGFLHTENHEFEIHRLDKEIGRTESDSLHGHVDLRIRGHHDDHHIRSHRFHALQKFQTIHFRHSDVRNNEREIVFVKTAKGFPPVVGHHAGIPLFRQSPGKDGIDYLFIIDDQDPVFQF